MLKKASSAIVQSFIERVEGGNNVISVGDNCRIESIKFTVRGNNCSCVLEDNVSSNALLAFFVVGNNCRIRIGAFTHFEGITSMQAIEDNMSIDIGRNCLFASAYLVTSDFHDIYDISDGQRINHPKPITIEDRVWIGKDATILKGAYVGGGSVVGIHSVVTGEFRKKNVIIAGNQAKIVKENIRWGHKLGAGESKPLELNGNAPG